MAANMDATSTLIPRTVMGALLATAICMPQMYQPGLNSLYRLLAASTLYRLSIFETLLTVTCYSALETIYVVKLIRHPHLRLDMRRRDHHSSSNIRTSSNNTTITTTNTLSNNTKQGRTSKIQPPLPGMKRPSRRLHELVTYVAPLLLLDLTMIKKFAGVSVDDIRRSGGYAPLSSVHMSSHMSGHVSGSFLLPTLHNFTAASPLQIHRALPPLPPSSRRIAVELMAAFILYDALFFTLHAAFHLLPPLARFHAAHHTHAEMHPQVTNRLSITERLSLVLLANFSLNIIGSHVLTRTCFVPLFVYLLIEVHCGLDLPWGYDKLLPAGLGAGPRVHAHHHRTGRGSYAPFFTWCDAALLRLMPSTHFKSSPNAEAATD